MVDRDELLDHDYDGIKEYDNDLPRWWLNIFWLTAIFGLAYLIYTHWYAEPDSVRIAREVAEIKEIQAKSSAASESTITEEYLLSLVSKPEVVAKGKEIFTAKCMACHGMNAEGIVGPNMTDNYWIHGNKMLEMRTVVLNGVLDKGMVAWKGMMTDEEINSVLAFIRSLRGSKPANPKAPQGVLVE